MTIGSSIHASFLFLGLACAGSAQTQEQLDRLPPYKPAVMVTGKITAWGNPEQQKVWDGWSEGFPRFQPGVKMTGYLKSSAQIAGALYTEVANFGVAGRDLMPIESLAYKTRFGYDVFQIVHGSGSFNVPKQTAAVCVFVQKDNPLTRLTLAQVDGIFSRDRMRGAPKAIRKWGQLGLTGEWADKTINVYAPTVDFPATGLFFQNVVFNGGVRWNPDVKEFDVTDKLVEVLGGDRYGIAWFGYSNVTPLVKPLALAENEAGPYLEGSPETVYERTWPLTRNIYCWVNRDPKSGFTDPTVREFLRYILSREGQAAVVAGKYIPLNPRKLAEELKKLD